MANENEELQKRVNDLQEWINTEYKEYMVAVGSFGRLSMRVCLAGNIQIWHNKDVIWQGVRAFSAIEAWDKYVLDKGIQTQVA